MKKIILFLLIGVIFNLLTADTEEIDLSFLRKEGKIVGKVFNDGLIKNEKMAKEIGDTIIKNYFNDTMKNRQLIAKYYEKYGVWLIIKTLPPNNKGKGIYYVGGSYYVVIRKSDGAVLEIWGTK